MGHTNSFGNGEREQSAVRSQRSGQPSRPFVGGSVWGLSQGAIAPRAVGRMMFKEEV